MSQTEKYIRILAISIDAILSLRIVSRADWGAQPAKRISRMNRKAQYVVIHHTDVPGFCATENVCKSNMRSIQSSHQQKWTDIGYK